MDNINKLNFLTQQNLNIQSNVPQVKNLVAEHREKEILFWDESLKILKSIEDNTANLSIIVDLINKNTDQQEEILNCLAQIHDIATAQSKPEAESKYEQVMKKICEITGNAEAISKLVSYGTLVYQFVLQNVDKVQTVIDKVIK